MSASSAYSTTRRRRSMPLWARWLLAAGFVAATIFVQGEFGPRASLSGRVELPEGSYPYELPRGASTDAPTQICIPTPDGRVSAMLYWRAPAGEGLFAPVPLARRDDQLVGVIPTQPAGGTTEYFVEVTTPRGPSRVPDGTENVTVRFHDPVPDWLLWPHIGLTLLALLVGAYAGIAALLDPKAMLGPSRAAFLLVLVGGVILGAAVEDRAFGAGLSGFPWSGDWTINKLTVISAVWLLACVFPVTQRQRDGTPTRTLVGLAALVMLAAYALPHSLAR